MRKMFKFLLVQHICLSFAGLAWASPLKEIEFIKIAPQDAKAVIKGGDGKLLVIKPGDSVAEGVTVKEIVAGRIVLEELSENGLETVFVRMSNGKSVIERLRKQPEKKPMLMAPSEAGPVSSLQSSQHLGSAPVAK